MVRFNFSSPNGGGKLSRKERLEQAKREAEAEQSRRRNFGFLKTGEKRMSSVSMNRTREHARQLAMAYNEPEGTPTSVSSGQGLLNFGEQEHFDPFSSASTDFANFSARQQVVTNARSGSLLDHHFSKAHKQEREPTASTQDSLDTSSIGSAYDMDFLSSRQPNAFASQQRRTPNKPTSLDQFVESTRSPYQGTGSYSGASLDRSGRVVAERSVISMPTIPTNSSMQASFARQQSLSSSSAPRTSSVGAAARRRMRNQMRQTSSSASVNSSFDDASFTSTPPESPASTGKHISGSTSKNKLTHYQRPQTGSFYSQSSSGNNSHASNSQISASESNALFDKNAMDGGFTFDAFGLDQSQVEREINEAMQELAGQGMPGFSVFFNGDSDGEFPSMNWDSPANSHRSSPVPSDSEQDGFEDGFRVTRGLHAYPNASPSASDRSFSSPASRRLMRSQAKGSTTPPRWEAPSSARRKDPARNIFPDPVSNPWKEDPWGSGDEATNSDFGGTKSEILPSSFQPQPRYTSTYADSKSDVGVSTPYQKSVSFSKDVRLPEKLPPPEHMNDESSNDEESDIMKEELVKEFAQDFVSRVSPRHSQSPTARQYEHDNSRMPQYSYNQPDSYSNQHASQSADFEQHQHEYRYGNIGAASEDLQAKSSIGAHDMAYDDEYETSQHAEQDDEIRNTEHYEQSHNYAHYEERPYMRNRGEQAHYEQSEYLSSRNHMNVESASDTSRFSNLRSKYESKRGTSPPENPSDNLQDGHYEDSQYDDQEQFVNYEDEAFSNVGTDANEAMRGEPTVATSTRKWTNNYNSNGQANYRPEIPAETNSDYSDYGNGASLDKETFEPSDTSTSRTEEKKDDEQLAEKPASKISKWQAWESKATPPTSTTTSPIPFTRKKWGSATASSSHTAIAGLPIKTPDMLEANRQEKAKNRTEELRPSHHDKPSPSNLKSPGSFEKAATVSTQRASECQTERTSFASLRSRLKPSGSREESKSEGGAAYKSSVAASVVDRLRRESPTSGTISGSKSDTPSTPTFLAGVKLRKTGALQLGEQETKASGYASSPMNASPSSLASLSHGWQGAKKGETHVEPEKPVERKLTYRERRELELKRQEEEKAKLEGIKKEGPKKDVASLIRQRIAANKQQGVASPPTQSSTSPSVAQFRKNLKPVNTASSSPRLAPISSPKFVSQQSPIHTQQPPQASPSNSDQPLQPKRFEDKPSSTASKSYLDHTPAQIDTQSRGGPYDRSGLLSPASAMTEMTYSTDNSQSGNGNFAKPQASPGHDSMPQNPEHGSPSPSDEQDDEPPPSTNKIAALFASRSNSMAPVAKAPTPSAPPPPVPPPINRPAFQLSSDEDAGKGDVKAMLSNFLGARSNPLALIPAPKKEDDTDALMYQKRHEEHSPEKKREQDRVPLPPAAATGGARPALKDDPKYERYFRMLKVGMPMEVVKHAMLKDGNDPSVMDGDHNKPVGLPLKEDPKYTKYFKMLKLGMPVEQVKHAMTRDGMEAGILDMDPNLPATAFEQKSKSEPKTKDTHRRARLHWKTLAKITRNSLWSRIEKEPEATNVDFDEEEFKELFQADIDQPSGSPKRTGSHKKKGAAVRVIDAKRANNGGIILARVKMSHDEMADIVDRIDGDALSAEQIENIVEFLPTKEERMQLEKYMLEGGQDAAEKFDGLCECEKFMVSMMTVKHAKRKVRALLFKLQFISCLQSIAEDAALIEEACDQLKNSTRLTKLLGIVLQFGNRLNTAGKSSQNKAGAFKLDSLLKLSQAKAFDKKTTFLHYVVMIVHRNNELLLNFTDDLPTVLKADKVYWDQCLQDLEEVENQLENVRKISLHEARSRRQSRASSHSHNDDDSLGDIELTLEEEVEALRATPTGMFTLSAIKQVSALRDKVETTRNKFIQILEYFGEDDDSMQPHELFNIFCVFARDFNKAKEEAFANMKKKMREDRKKNGRTSTPNAKHGKPPSVPERKALRASSLQPNFSKVISDVRSMPTNGNRVQQQSQDASNTVSQPPSTNKVENRTPLQNNGPPTRNREHETYRSQPSNDVNVNMEFGMKTPQQSTQQRVQLGYRKQQGESNPAVANNLLVPTHQSHHSNHPYSNNSNPQVERAPLRQDMTEPALRVNPVQRSYFGEPEIPEAPVPRGMQESGRFMGVSAEKGIQQTPSTTSSTDTKETSSAESMRQARLRRQRQMKVLANRNTPAIAKTNPVPDRREMTAQLEEARSPRSSPSAPEEDNDSSQQHSPTASVSSSSRHSMRHRRLQAMKRRTFATQSRTAD